MWRCKGSWTLEKGVPMPCIPFLSRARMRYRPTWHLQVGTGVLTAELSWCMAKKQYPLSHAVDPTSAVSGRGGCEGTMVCSTARVQDQCLERGQKVATHRQTPHPAKPCPALSHLFKSGCSRSGSCRSARWKRDVAYRLCTSGEHLVLIHSGRRATLPDKILLHPVCKPCNIRDIERDPLLEVFDLEAVHGKCPMQAIAIAMR